MESQTLNNAELKNLATYQRDYKTNIESAHKALASLVATSCNVIAYRKQTKKLNATLAFLRKLPDAAFHVRKFSRLLTIASADWQGSDYVESTARIKMRYVDANGIEHDKKADAGKNAVALYTCDDFADFRHVWENRRAVFESDAVNALRLVKAREEKEKVLKTDAQTVTALQNLYRNAATTQAKKAIALALRDMGADVPEK